MCMGFGAALLWKASHSIGSTLAIEASLLWKASHSTGLALAIDCLTHNIRFTRHHIHSFGIE